MVLTTLAPKGSQESNGVYKLGINHEPGVYDARVPRA